MIKTDLYSNSDAIDSDTTDSDTTDSDTVVYHTYQLLDLLELGSLRLRLESPGLKLFPW